MGHPDLSICSRSSMFEMCWSVGVDRGRVWKMFAHMSGCIDSIIIIIKNMPYYDLKKFNPFIIKNSQQE